MHSSLPARVTLHDGEVDLTLRLVRREGREIPLREREVAVLSWLAMHCDRPVRRAELLRAVWGYRGGGRTRVVDVTVRRLREKIEADPSAPRHLLTLRGVGYRFSPVAVDGGQEDAALWSSLSAEEQDALSRLSVFRAPFPAEGAAVLLPEDAAPWGILRRLHRCGALTLTEGRHALAEGLREPAEAALTAPAAVATQHMAWAVRLRGEPARQMLEDVLCATERALDLGDLSAAMAGCAALRSAGAGVGALGALLESRTARAEGALRRAEALAEAAVTEARAGAAPRRLAEALRGLSWQRNHQGKLAEAVALLDDAEAAAQRAEAPLLLARIRSDLAVNCIERGELRRAERLLTGAAASARLGGSPPAAVADVRVSFGLLALARRRYPEAEAAFAEAEALYTDLDEPRGVGWAVNNRGEACKLDGRLDEAAACFRRAVEWFASAGSGSAAIPAINLAQLRLWAGDDATDALTGLLHQAEAEGRHARAGKLHLLLAGCALQAGDAPGASHHLDNATARLDRTGFTEAAVAEQARWLADRAEEADQPALARQALLLCLAQLRALRAPEEAAAVAERLAGT